MNCDEMNKKMGQVIAKAWADADFKAKLIANPAATLKAEGIQLPKGLKVNVVENTAEQFHLVIPPNPKKLSEDDPPNPKKLSEDDLNKVAGGFYSPPGETCPHCGSNNTFFILMYSACCDCGKTF